MDSAHLDFVLSFFNFNFGGSFWDTAWGSFLPLRSGVAFSGVQATRQPVWENETRLGHMRKQVSDPLFYLSIPFHIIRST